DYYCQSFDGSNYLLF
nr:immunoglobulin light chain junction region [Macaca mulatta]MOY14872.1 immunoglobulin light chain junction region [Macaca mulatta]MOY15100.1 immunoglobulin light chain junction region [Macaca mulatta]MOY15165.1 immunoglobulin light chain junction region [Macaca mulatta]MOY15185.1 immunoglobulin light chain junction region [Macaca mulatta]